MPVTAPLLLMVVLSVAYLALEVRQRRATGFREGVLDHASVGVVLAPVLLYLVAAVLLSTAGWAILSLPGVLTVLGLPIGLGAALRAFRGDRDRLREADLTGTDPGLSRLGRWSPLLLALGLSLTGLVVLWASER